MENLFFIRFLESSILISVFTVLIIGIKTVLRKHISVKWQYYIWIIFLIMLIIPFVPRQFLGSKEGDRWSLYSIERSQDQNSIKDLMESGTPKGMSKENHLSDFAVSMDYSQIRYLNGICIGVWFIGILAYMVIILRGYRQIRVIKCSVRPIKSPEIEYLFKQCKNQLKVSKNIILGESPGVQSPMAFGLRQTYIILPKKAIEQLTVEDIRYILLHELHHYKHKDILMNYMMCILQGIYWFNPFVHLAFKIMQTDREIICDRAVLDGLDESQYIQYGKTIINFAQIVSQKAPIPIATSIGGAKKQIKKRIEKIASCKKETTSMKFKSILIFIVIGIFILSQAPAISILADDYNQYDFEGEQVVYEDLSSYFNGVEGSFVLYDLQDEMYHIYNQEKSVTRVAPNSTYKIYSALIGLEENKIHANHSSMHWDGKTHPFEAWNQDQDLYSAMSNSVNWYFQNLDKSVGKKQLQFYFDQIGYGNRNLSSRLSDYWMGSSLRISPVEQVELLRDLYTNDMLFKKEHMELVKETLKISEKDGVVLSGKTGTGMIEGKSIDGWFIGFVENGEETFIFATYIEGEDNISGSLAADITRSILGDKNIY